MEALLCFWSSSIAFLCNFSISSVSYLRSVNQDCTMAFKRRESMDLYSSITISPVLLSPPFLIIPCFVFAFLIATESWADICIELSIITWGFWSQVEIASLEPIILYVKLGLSFPTRITLHLSTSDFICDFITLSFSATRVFLWLFTVSPLPQTPLISPANFSSPYLLLFWDYLFIFWKHGTMFWLI